MGFECNKSLLAACIGSWSQFFPTAVRVGVLLRFVESVLTVVKIVARFRRFMDSVLTTKKPVKSM